ncbi:AI-2E family transporter [Haloplasma contractile]|uniref:AI-2E family transporter n=1 Tax=Haloplasma contractile SSD-17B TaxID=1033810 RepID=U2EEW9_9MOLU|nr:AI-2E family transporter [Haloplasma contractile]ERJ13493.1 protein of unknown function DUF20 protein [Haloplasma contractile SSD-17B]
MKTLKSLIETKRHLYNGTIFFLILLNFYMAKLLVSQKIFKALGMVIVAILIPFLISFVIVYIFRPVLLWIERKSHVKTWVSTSLFMAFLLVSVLMFIEYFIPLLFTQINNLIREFPHYKDQLLLQVKTFEQKHEFLQSGTLSQILKQFTNRTSFFKESNSTRLILHLMKQFASFLWICLLIPIIIFMMVKDYDLILNSLLKLTPRNEQDTIKHLFKRIDRKLGLYIRGQLLVFIYMFLGSFSLFSLIGLNHSFLFAVLFALTNFIPYLGPYLGGIPLSIYAYLQSPHILLFILLIIFFLQQFDGDIGQPIIFGKQLNLHPLVIIICMATGSVLFGVVGLIIAIPLFIIIKEVFYAYKSRLYR